MTIIFKQCHRRHKTIISRLKKINQALLLLPVFYAASSPLAFSTSYPFPEYPIISQPYINRTTPLMIAFVDNSTTMNTNARIAGLSRGSGSGKVPTWSWPDRIDIAKNALYKTADRYYDEFDWGVFVIADQRRRNDWWPYNDTDLGLDGSRPIWETNSAYDWLRNIPAAKRSSLVKLLGTDGGNGTTGVSGWTYHSDSRGSFYGKPMLFDPNKPHSESNKTDLLDSIRNISTTKNASYMNNTYPQLLNFSMKSYHGSANKNTVRDMPSVPDFVKYRCQDIFTVVFADGNRVNDSDVRDAARYAANNHPRSSSELDGDRKPFNGPDFPNQYIQSSGIGVDGRNASDFQRFAQDGKGAYMVSDDAEEIGNWFEEFIEKRRPFYQFSTATPGASYLIGDSGKRISISIQSELNRYLSFTQIMYLDQAGGLTTPDNVTAKYKYDHHAVIAHSDKQQGKWVDLIAASESELSQHFDNGSFGIPSHLSSDNYAKKYIPWLATKTEHDGITGYRNRAVKLSAIPGADGSSESGFRYLGDTLSTNVYMLGGSSNSLKIQDYMIFGSNDGMLKIYQATDDINRPYIYAAGVMPGNIPRDDYSTLYKAMYNRAKGGYGVRDENLHLFGINGGVATRHTNNGQVFSVTTLGQGGRGVFASNIAGNKDDSESTPVGLSAPKDKWSTSIPLWDSASSSSLTDEFGYTIGTPIIGVIATKRTPDGKPIYDDIYHVALASNGYDHPDTAKKGQNSVMVVDALGINIGEGSDVNAAGELIQKVLTTSPLNLHYGLSAPSLVDLDFDGIADVAYAGDYNGDMYRIDFRGETPENWKIVKIFTGSPAKPITMAPAFSQFGGRTIVTFATGSALYPIDIRRGQQTIYGIYDDVSKSDPVPVGDENLQLQTITQTNKGVVSGLSDTSKRTLRMLSNNPLLAEHKGWKVNLEVGNGHESPTTAISVRDGTVVLSTSWLRPDAFVDVTRALQAKCFRDMSGRSGSLMMLNVLNGGQPDKKIPHLTAKLDDGSQTVIGGFLTNDLTSPVLAYSKHTYFMNNEGQFSLYNNVNNSENSNSFLGNSIYTKGAKPWCKFGEAGCGKAPVKRCDKNNPTSILFTEGGITESADMECYNSPNVKRLSWRIIY